MLYHVNPTSLPQSRLPMLSWLIDHMSIRGPLSLTLTRRTTIQNIAEQGVVIKNGFLFIIQYKVFFSIYPF